MLQVYVSSVSNVCFICVFRTHVGCCICFTHTLHMFYLDVAYGCIDFQVCFSCSFKVFQKDVSSVSTAFRRMLQLLYLDVSKVNGMFLHLSSLTFYCIISPRVDRVSIQCRGRVLPKRRRRAPFPSCSSGGAGPACNAKWALRCIACQGRQRGRGRGLAKGARRRRLIEGECPIFR
jgi:hypothetical protein